MSKAYSIFKNIRFDFAATQMLHAAANALIIGLFGYILFTIPTGFGFRIRLFGVSHDILLAILLATIWFIASLFIRLTKFNYAVIEKQTKGLDDVLTTAHQYRRKDNPFRQQLLDELYAAARKADTTNLLRAGRLVFKSTIILGLTVFVVVLQFTPLLTGIDPSDLIPDALRDVVGSNLGIQTSAPDIALLEDDAIYGDRKDISVLADQSITLQLNTGSTGGNLDSLSSSRPVQVFDNLYDTDTIRAVVDPTEVQKLPRDVGLAREYSLKVRNLQ